MIFLIEFSPNESRTVSIRSYEADQRDLAHADRLNLELDLHRCELPHEAILLEADSKEALLKTHGRFFATSGSGMAIGAIIESIGFR